MEHALEVRIEDGGEIFFLHAHEKAVARNARVVDEDVDAAELLDDGFDHLIDCRCIRDIRLEDFGLAARRLDGGFRFFGFGRVARIVDGDARAHRCKLQRDGTADAAGCARDERRLPI